MWREMGALAHMGEGSRDARQALLGGRAELTRQRFRGCRARCPLGSRPGREGLRGPPASSVGELAAVLAFVVVAVRAGADRLPPPLVVAVPLHSLLEALGEATGRFPAELADLGARERVAAVVAGAVGHILD